jgi:hypothetical protein
METSGSDSVHWEVEVNGNMVGELDIPSDRACAYQAIVPKAHFQSGMNTVTVRVLGGLGILKVSEFAFHYKRNI